MGKLNCFNFPTGRSRIGGVELRFSSLFLGFNFHIMFIKSVLTVSHLGKYANASQRDNRSAAEMYRSKRSHEDTMPDQYPSKLAVIKINDYHEIGLKVCARYYCFRKILPTEGTCKGGYIGKNQ